MTASIVAIDYYLPLTVRTNRDISKLAGDIDEDSIYRSSGILERRLAGPGEAPSDMACKAAGRLLARTGNLTHQIDGLLFCTHLPDFRCPVTAALIHERLGLPTRCVSLDVPGGCAGFTNALMISKSLISAGEATTVLILTAEAISLAIPENDHVLMSIFGDGASAALVVKSRDGCIGKFCAGTDGAGSSALYVDGGGARAPVANPPFGRLHMDGSKMLLFALRRVPILIKEILDANGLSKDQIDLYIFHQASGFMLSALRKKCGIPPEKFFVCIERYGNTVSSTIPIALVHAFKADVVKPGMKVMLLGFGVGFAWSGTVITWPKNYIEQSGVYE